MKKFFLTAALLLGATMTAGAADFDAGQGRVGLQVHNFFDPATVVGVETRDLKVSDDMVRVGVNLKFNPWANPMVARY